MVRQAHHERLTVPLIFLQAHSCFMVRLPVHPAALEVANLEVGELADAVTGQVTGQVQRLLASSQLRANVFCGSYFLQTIKGIRILPHTKIYEVNIIEFLGLHFEVQ